jgi:hypothetical protein
LDRPTLVFTAVLVAAVVLGLAATFLQAPSETLAPNPARGPVSSSFAVVGGVTIAIVFGLVGSLIFYRMVSDRAPRVPALYATVLSIFLVSIAFLAVAHFVSPGSNFGVENGTQPTNPTTPNATGPATPGNATPTPIPLAPGIPGWVGYVALGLAVLVVVALVVPGLLRRADPASDPVAPVRRSLEAALHQLSTKGATDARGTIIALYARLLEVVAAYLEQFDSATPREIERVCVQRFGVAPSHAGDLTRLFEEARYSSHPFGEEAVGRARTALEAALSDVRVRSYTGGG